MSTTFPAVQWGEGGGGGGGPEYRLTSLHHILSYGYCLNLHYLNLRLDCIQPCFTDPQAPRSVASFCAVIVWQAPFRAYGPIVGYDVMFVDGEDTIMITKDRDELFHTVQRGNLPNGGGNVVVQVSVLIDPSK